MSSYLRSLGLELSKISPTDTYLERQIWERISSEKDYSLCSNMVLCSNFKAKLMTLVS